MLHQLCTVSTCLYKGRELFLKVTTDRDTHHLAAAICISVVLSLS